MQAHTRVRHQEVAHLPVSMFGTVAGIIGDACADPHTTSCDPRLRRARILTADLGRPTAADRRRTARPEQPRASGARTARSQRYGDTERHQDSRGSAAALRTATTRSPDPACHALPPW